MDYSEMNLDELYKVIINRHNSLNALKSLYAHRKSNESGKPLDAVKTELECRMAIDSLPKLNL